MRKYTHGYIAIPANLKDAVNEALFDAGLGIDFFSVPCKDAGKAVFYAASASLSKSQWSAVQKAIDSTCEKKDAEAAVKKIDERSTRAAFVAEKVERIKKAKEQVEPANPDKGNK